MFKLVLTVLAAMSTFASARAQNCPVEKFTVQDLERLKFSESLALSVIDLMDVSQQQQNNTSFNLGVIIQGTPINLGLSDMKAVSNYVKKNSNFSFSRDQQIDYLRTNLSLVGAQMYDDCLKRRTQNFSVEVPTYAYTEDDFILKLKWTPTYSVGGRTSAPAIVIILNGTVDGAAMSKKDVEDQKAVSFVIHRSDRTKSLQIVPTVDGYDNGADTQIVVPPIVSANYTTVVRTWPVAPEQPITACGDDGGGNCGADEKHFLRCIHASENGMLLPSTLSIEANYRNSSAKPSSTNDYANVCVDFVVLGRNTFGQKGYSAISNTKFSVREVVPLVRPNP
jgi:hypothetical protein